MEMKHFVMSAKGGVKKYFITFAIVFVTAAIVIAVFALATGGSRVDWLSDSNGLARESLFPYVFTSSGKLNIINNDLKVKEIDDTVSNAVHDAELGRVYYTRAGELFEYSIEKNVRTKLCGGVRDFYLFEERRSVLYTGVDGNLYIYKYNGKVTEKLADAVTGTPDNPLQVISGESHIAYLTDYNSENGTAKLCVSDLFGRTACIAEGVTAAGDIYIWNRDAVISFYKDGLLVIADLKGEVKKSFADAVVIRESGIESAMDEETVASEYGGTDNICYVFSDFDGTAGKLNYVKVSGSKVSAKTVAENVYGIVGFEADERLVIYTVEAEDGFDVYAAWKNRNIKKITSKSAENKVAFCTNSYCLTIIDANGRLSFIDVYDGDFTEYYVADGVTGVYTYPDKPFVLYTLADVTFAGFITDASRVESFSENSIRLYGKYNDQYLACRVLASGGYSLDFVRDENITRISGEIGGSVVFDKDIENVLYVTDNELYLWRNGESVSLGYNADEFESVRIVAEKD